MQVFYGIEEEILKVLKKTRSRTAIFLVKEAQKW